MYIHFEPDSLDTPPHLSPAPVWDTPVTPSFGCQLLLPPSTTDLSVVTGVEVVSLAIGATAGVCITFGVGEITRHVERKFDVWRLRCGGKDHLAWVSAAAARRGGVESRSVVSSGGTDAYSVAMAAPLDTDDYFQDAKPRKCGYPSSQRDYLQRDINSLCEATLLFDNLMHACQHLIDEHDPVLLLSRFCSAPLPRHYAIARQVLHYLKGTKYLRLDLRCYALTWTSSTPRVTTLLKLIHLDIYGPFPVTAPHGKAYFVLCLDDASSVVSLQDLALQSDVTDAWRILKVKWELQRGRLEELEELALGRIGVEVTFELPMTYWGETAYLQNLTSTSTLPSGITPFKVSYGRKPDISHLHVWGTRCFVMVMGYPPGERGYRNTPYNFIHSVSTSMHDCLTLPFLEWRDSHIPAVPTLPHNPSNLEDRPSHLGTEGSPSRSLSPSTVPVPAAPPPPPPLEIAPASPNSTRTRSRDPSITWRKKKIEPDRSHLARVREAAAQRGGVLDRMDRRADRGVHERDQTAQGIWIHQEINIDSFLAEHELTSCNSVVMPLDPSHPLGRDRRSVVRVGGCGLGRGQDRTSIDFGVCVLIWGGSNRLASEETKFTRISCGARTDAAERKKVTEKELADL